MRAIRILLLGVLVATGVWVQHALDLSAESLIAGSRALIESCGRWGPLVFVGLCAAGLVLHAPGALLIALGGILFGKLEGFVYGWIGAVLGVSLTFLLARYALRRVVQERVVGRSDRLRALDARLETQGFLTVVGLRFILFLAPPLNWLIGTTAVRYPQYVAGSAFGLVPGVALTVYFADEITALDSWRELATPSFAVPALLALGLAAIGAVIAYRSAGTGRSRA